MTARPQLVAAPAASDSRLAEARGLVRSGRIRSASAFLSALRLDPRSVALSAADRSLMLALAVECHLAVGDLEAAGEVATLLAPLSEEPGLAAAFACYSLGDVAAALGSAEIATDHFLAAGDADDSEVVPWRAGAALAMLPLGRRREALDLAREHLDVVQDRPAYEVATALRTLATTDPQGRGVLRLREARALLVTSDAERLRAQVDTDLAGQLVLVGEPTEAVVLLRTAEAYAARESLWPLQGRVRRLLERLGETPRRLEAEALAELTVAERRVTLLALDGSSNRQIAEQLRVSVKAVEGHLSKVYRKLGVSSRTALAASLHLPG